MAGTKYFLFILVMTTAYLYSSVLGTGYYDQHFWELGKKRPAYGKVWNNFAPAGLPKEYLWTSDLKPLHIFRTRFPFPKQLKYQTTQYFTLPTTEYFKSVLPPIYLPFQPSVNLNTALDYKPPSNNKDTSKPSQVIEAAKPLPLPKKVFLLQVKRDPGRNSSHTSRMLDIPEPYTADKTTDTVGMSLPSVIVKPSDSRFENPTSNPSDSFDIQFVDMHNPNVILEPGNVLSGPKPIKAETTLSTEDTSIPVGAYVTGNTEGTHVSSPIQTDSTDDILPSSSVVIPASNKIIVDTPTFIDGTGSDLVIDTTNTDIHGVPVTGSHVAGIGDTQTLSLPTNVAGNTPVATLVGTEEQPITFSSALPSSLTGDVSFTLLDVKGRPDSMNVMSADITVPNFHFNDDFAFLNISANPLQPKDLTNSDVGGIVHHVLGLSPVDIGMGTHSLGIDSNIEATVGSLTDLAGHQSTLATSGIKVRFNGDSRDGDVFNVIETDERSRAHGGIMAVTGNDVSTMSPGTQLVTVLRNPFTHMMSIEPFGPGPYGYCRAPSRVICGARFGWDHVTGMAAWCQQNCVVFMYSSYCDDDRCECECKLS